jgi:YhcN/YlaJ family sporulation lipoprotein
VRRSFAHRTLVLIWVMVLLVALGCAGPAEKPAPIPSPALEQADFRTLADALSKEAVKTQGVDNATIILQGAGKRINALVGLTLTGEPGQVRTQAIEDEVERRLQETDPRVKNVYITSDPELVQRIKAVARAIADGQSVGELQGDINDISRQIK